MRKIVVVSILVLFAAVMALPAAAEWRWQDPDATKLRLSVSAFQFSDEQMRDELGTGIGLTADLPLRMSGKDGETAVTLSAIRASKTYDTWDNTYLGYTTVDESDTTLGLLLTQRYGPGVTRERGPYLGVGAGVNYTTAKVEIEGDSVSESESNFAYHLLAGLQLSKDMFLEFRYVDGGLTDNTGYTLGFGLSF